MKQEIKSDRDLLFGMIEQGVIKWLEHSTEASFDKNILLDLLELHYMWAHPTSAKPSEPGMPDHNIHDILNILPATFAEAMLVWLRVSY